MQDRLTKCEQYSYKLGYRWNPTKCVIVERPHSVPTKYQLHKSTIPTDTAFTYLGIPINYKGQLDGKQLIERNTISAEKDFRLLRILHRNKPKWDFKTSISTHLYPIHTTKIRIWIGNHHTK